MSELVKHYQNTMQGIPQLTNNWGAMIALLDAVLVTGFNHVPILGLSKSSASSITATINLGSGHGFIDRQVVRIAGSTNGWGGDYKVLSADSASITIECTAEHPSTVLGVATCFTAPLDFEIVYQTPAMSTEPKRAYRSTNPESLGLILLVHDFCVSGAALNGAKFAKVAIVFDMTDINTITGNQMPFDSGNPNKNWEWSGTDHGWAKWYYRTAMHDGASWIGTSDSETPSNGNSPFLIVGDGISFALNVYISNWESYSNYGVFEFIDERYNGRNLCLLAFGVHQQVRESTALYAEARNALIIKNITDGISGSNVKNIHALIWFGESGIQCGEAAGMFMFHILPNTLNPRPESINTAKHILSDFVLLSPSNLPVGVLPFLKATTRSENAQAVDLKIGKYASFFRNSTAGICTKNVLLLESL